MEDEGEEHCVDGQQCAGCTLVTTLKPANCYSKSEQEQSTLITLTLHPAACAATLSLVCCCQLFIRWDIAAGTVCEAL